MLAALLERLRSAPSRTGLVIITLYGEAIAPRGGSLSLAHLRQVFAAMGVGEGVVRTAVSRLAADGWLERTKQGRRSFYRLAPRGREATETAIPLIYGPLCPPAGILRLVLAERGIEPGGLGVIAPGVMVDHRRLAASTGAVTLELSGAPEMLTQMARRAWRLDELAARYQSFLPLIAGPPLRLEGLDALVARVLLVHEYRRVVLRDPHLPRNLLPPDWPGFVARRQCRDAHEALRETSEAWLDQADGEAGTLPPVVGARVFAGA
jgi:phenylacetic acid degradation operon negative regulatory protein